MEDICKTCSGRGAITLPTADHVMVCTKCRGTGRPWKEVNKEEEELDDLQECV